jgi:hypothetical protein
MLTLLCASLYAFNPSFKQIKIVYYQWECSEGSLRVQHHPHPKISGTVSKIKFLNLIRQGRLVRERTYIYFTSTDLFQRTRREGTITISVQMTLIINNFKLSTLNFVNVLFELLNVSDSHE